jgi:benzoyl-CoA reductase/2-hydroxyglutaryl-CoA dehydratase subunit BcrC/BadD/HgdB
MGKQIGITTTVPVEILLAAGCTPVDLNNRFVTDPDPAGLVREAEELGLARTLCAWIKGIYAWALAHPELDTIIAITQGDCSNTHALMELLSVAGRRVIPFDFPFGRDAQALELQIKRLAQTLGADLNTAEQVRQRLAPIRKDLARLDELTWQDGKVTGGENHLWLVSSSDFDGDPDDFHKRLGSFLSQAEARPPRGKVKARLGILGVPTIMDDLHERLEELGAAVVFNEVPRQFAMLPPDNGAGLSLVEQYRRYTYPYDIFHRMEDIKREVERRRLDGLVHYTQSFCFRQMQDMVLRDGLKLPMLTLEGDRVGPVDARTKLRLEAFIDVLR